MPEMIEEALEDVASCELVDHFAAAVATGVGGDEHSLDRRTREAFVPEQDRQERLLAEVAGEGTSRLRAAAFGAVHVQREAEDNGDGRVFGDQLDEAGGICSELGPGDGFERIRRACRTLNRREKS